MAGKEMSDEEYRAFLLEDAGGGVAFLALCTDLLKEWWPYRKQPNVLFVHYSDRLRDDRLQIQRMANFIGQTLTEEELEHIVDKCSFDKMKKVEKKLEMPRALQPFKDRGLVPQNVFPASSDTSGMLMDKGAKRQGNKELATSIVDGVTAFMVKEFGADIFRWIQNGGDIPDVELPVKKLS